MESNVPPTTNWIRIHKCPACGSSKREYWLRDKNRREGLDIECDAWKCSECASVFLDPVPNSETAAQLYSETHSAPQNSGFLGRQADRVVDSWARLWSPSLKLRGEPRGDGRGKKMLSIGCGYATNLQKYQSRSWNIYGVDSDLKAIEWNRKNLSGHYFHGSFEEYEFEQKFDVIHCSAVLEHVYDPLSFIEKARTLLRPGGRLLFYTPNGGGFMTRYFRANSIAFWVPFHLVLFTREGLLRLAQRAGLDARVPTISEPHL